MNRRDAGLCAWRHPSWAAGTRDATDRPAVRVLGRGGGGNGPKGGGPAGRNGLRGESSRRRCLTQRRELERRVDGVTHQRPERALVLAAAGQQGEHVFGKLWRGSDGIALPSRPP